MKLTYRRFRRLSIAVVVSTAVTLAGWVAAIAIPWHGFSTLDQWREIRAGRLVYRGPSSSANVAVTFDDGPDPRYTGRVLEILRRHGVHATFFVCGNKVAAHPELARQIVAEGNVIANHTLTHPHLERDSNAAVMYEIKQCAALIAAATHQHPKLFRAPRGLLNRDIVRDAEHDGYKIVQWSLAFDRASVKDSAALRRRILGLVRGGDVLLMHDGSSMLWDERAPTVRELDAILSGLERKGLHCVTVPELLTISPPVHPRPV